MSRAEREQSRAEVELVERAEELSVLADCLADVKEHSRGRLVLVRGEAGVGKTALFERFCDACPTSVRILSAGCDALFTPRPLGPLLDVARTIGGEFEEMVEGAAAPHDVAGALLEELQSCAPSVLVLEDLHWADEATLDVVRLMSRRSETAPALVLASYRNEALERSYLLRLVLGEIPARGSVLRLSLDCLSRDAVRELANSAGVDGDELYEMTGGNPFYVTEALAARSERVPATVRDAVHARAARLSAPARALLDAVAIAPQRTELWLLDALADTPQDALTECVGSGMLVTDTAGVAFRHELARLAIEDSLGSPRDWTSTAARSPRSRNHPRVSPTSPGFPTTPRRRPTRRRFCALRRLRRRERAQSAHTARARRNMRGPSNSPTRLPPPSAQRCSPTMDASACSPIRPTRHSELCTRQSRFTASFAMSLPRPKTSDCSRGHSGAPVTPPSRARRRARP